VLLYGALEAAGTISAAMVLHTAAELAEDLEGLPAAQAAAAAAAPADLRGRVAALETQIAKQKRVFQRLMDVLGGTGES
jgi:phage shock protein A